MTYPEMQAFLDRHVLQYMDEMAPSYAKTEWFFTLSCFVNDWITKDMARAICRSLTDRGYCTYRNGLWTDDGDMAGAGYGLTESGLVYLETLNG